MMNPNYPGKVPTAQLATEYQSGATLEEIGDKYGLSKQAVWQRFIHAGIVRRPRAGTPRKRLRRIQPRPCPGCGELFQPPNSKQICCSYACRDKIKPRKTFCKRGHPRTPENLYRDKACRKCLYLNEVRYRARKKEKSL